MITRYELEGAYDRGMVKVTEDVCGCLGTCCQIGNNAFYFGGLTAEEEDAKTYLKNVPKETVIDEIFETLNTCIKLDFPEEYEYYSWLIKNAQYRRWRDGQK